MSELARFGVATVYEASGRHGLIDADLVQVVPGARCAGPARIALCGQGDNLAVHAVMAELQAREVLVLTMPEPAPVALLGDLLATQANVRGAAGERADEVLDAAREREENEQVKRERLQAGALSYDLDGLRP